MANSKSGAVDVQDEPGSYWPKMGQFFFSILTAIDWNNYVWICKFIMILEDSETKTSLVTFEGY